MNVTRRPDHRCIALRPCTATALLPAVSAIAMLQNAFLLLPGTRGFAFQRNGEDLQTPPPSPSPPPPSAILVYSEERGKWPVLGDNIRLSSLCVLAMVRWFTPPLVVNPASTLLQQRGLLLWLGSDAPARAPAALVTCTPPFCSRGPCCSRGLHAHLHLSAHRRRCGRRYALWCNVESNCGLQG